MRYYLYRTLTWVLIGASAWLGWTVAMTVGKEVACGIGGGHPVQSAWSVECRQK